MIPDVYTKTLLHYNGVDNGTVFTDESGKRWSPGGLAVTSATKAKFGTTSFQNPGNYWIRTIDGVSDYDFGLNDFTLDSWVCPVNLDRDNNTLFFFYGLSNGFYVGFDVTGEFKCWDAWSDQSSMSGLHLPIDSSFHHVALVRSGGTFKFFLDATKGTDINGWWTTQNFGSINVTSELWIGNGYSGNNYFEGYIDETRISNGIARWTTTGFTLPTAPYFLGDPHNASRGRVRRTGNVDPRIAGYTA
jgi:hypothetical protein